MFKSELTIRRAGSKHWELVYPLTYNSLTVPAGFEFDGASIPRLLWPLIGHPLNGKHVRAASLHDYLYSIQMDRKAADLIFLEALRSDGVSKLRSYLMYKAVRLGGSKAYRSYGGKK